jgi:hypothetical protein
MALAQDHPRDFLADRKVWFAAERFVVDFVLPVLAAFAGVVIGHLLTRRREWGTFRRDHLMELAQHVGDAGALGAKLAHALEDGDDGRADELRWQVGTALFPIMIYGVFFRYYTTDLRDAIGMMSARLRLLQTWSQTAELRDKYPEGPLYVWTYGELGKNLIEALEREFEAIR